MNDSTVDTFIIMGTNFPGLKKWYFNLWIGPFSKTTKIGAPTKIKPFTVFMSQIFVLCLINYMMFMPYIYLFKLNLHF